MAMIHGRFEYDDSLTPGQSADGGLSQLLFDSEGRLADHATFHPDDCSVSDPAPGEAGAEPSDEEEDAASSALLALAVIAGGAAVAGGCIAIRRAAPPVQRFVQEQALPAVRSFWDRVRRQGLSDATVGHVSSPEPDASADAAVVGTDIDYPGPSMSAEEWYARYRALFTSLATANEQWRLLSSARVTDDAAVHELQQEMTRRSPREVMQRVMSALDELPAGAHDASAIERAEPLPVIEVPDGPGAAR